MTIRFEKYKKTGYFLSLKSCCKILSFTIRDIVGGQSMQIFSEINSILFSKAEDFYGKRELLRGFLGENRI